MFATIERSCESPISRRFALRPLWPCIYCSRILVFVLLFHSPPSFAQVFDPTSASCSTTTVGRIPINDLGTGTYQGYEGGVYPGGLNQPPPVHLAGGLAMADQVFPRNVAGGSDPVNGRIVLLSIGMSNATQEFSVFKAMADTSALKNPQLTIVDGAQGGQTAAIIANPAANFWNVVDQRLAAAGVTRQQVQVAWVKEADANPTAAFPRHAEVLDSEFVLIARNLKMFYPNISLAYWSSRTYGGYATTTLNPEPYAYESGFAVKWTITRQINGDTALTYTGTNARAPWLGWSAYLWADGLVPRSDGLTWLCDDFVSTDRTHPSPSGRRKVAQMLLNFFSTDTTAKGWFTAGGPTSTDPELTTSIPTRFSIAQNYPNPFNPTTTIKFSLPSTVETSHATSLQVYDLLGRHVATLINEPKADGSYEITWNAEGLASGVYLYQLEGMQNDGRMIFTRARTMLLLK